MWPLFLILLFVPVILAGFLLTFSSKFPILVTLFPDLAEMGDATDWTDILVLMVSTPMTFVTCFLILAVALIAAWGYWRDSKGVQKELDRFSEDVDKLEKSEHLPSAWEAFLEEGFKKYDDTIRAQWKRYQGVVEDVEGIARPNNVGTDCRLMSFVAPSEFFNEDTLYSSRINRELYGTIPGILTGLGILYTFAGLASGIYLAMNGAEGGILGTEAAGMGELMVAVNELLSGAGLAFMTSIVGLILSMTFNIGFVHREKKLLNQIDQINLRLERCIPVLTEDFVRFQSLLKLTEQEKCLQTILPSVREDMESFRSAILTALEQNSASVGESVKEALEGVKELVRRMNDDQAKIVVESLKTIIEQMEANLTNVFEKMSDSFENSANAVRTSVEMLDVVIAKLKSEIDAAGEAAKAQIQTLADDTNQISHGLMETLEKTATDIRSEMDAAGEAAKTQIQTLADDTNQISRGLLETLEKTAAGIRSEMDAAGETARTQIQTLAEETDRIGRSLLENLEKTVTELNRTVEATGESAAEHMEALSEQVASIENAIRTGSEEVRKNIVEMEEASGRTKEIFVELSSHVAEVSGELAEVVKSLEEEGAQFEHTVSTLRATLSVMSETANDIRKGKDSTDETLRTAIAEVQSVMTEATDALSEELSGMQKMLSDLSEQQANLAERARYLNEVMEQSVEALAVALEKIQGSLASNLSTVDDKLATAVRTMADGFGDSLEAQKFAVENLRETAEILSRRLEKTKRNEKPEAQSQQNATVRKE